MQIKRLILFFAPLLITDWSMILCYTLPLTPSSANARLGEDFTLNKTPEYLISIKEVLYPYSTNLERSGRGLN